MKNYKNLPIDPTPTPPLPTLTRTTVRCPLTRARGGRGYVVVGGTWGFGWVLEGVRRGLGVRWAGTLGVRWGRGYVGGGGMLWRGS